MIPAVAGSPTHAVRSPRSPRSPKKLFAAILGTLAAVLATCLGTSALLTSERNSLSSPTSASLITVAPRIPLSDRELGALVGKNPDFGTLTDPKKRASCLNGLGYPASMQVLGASPIQVNGSAAIVLVMPGDHPAELIALAVSENCSVASTGLIANTTVTRP